MRHFLYRMKAADPAPTGVGDTATWFKYYKLEDGGETYVPAAEESYDALEGDLLWFVMDGTVIGYAPILRQVDDGMNGRLELWFDSTKYVDALVRAGDSTWGTIVPEEQARLWLDRLAGKKP
jgi:hypothetical protein